MVKGWTLCSLAVPPPKRWEDNIREWTGLEFSKSQRAVENREKMEKTGCKIILQGTVKGAKKTRPREEDVRRHHQGMDRPGVH